MDTIGKFSGKNGRTDKIIEILWTFHLTELAAVIVIIQRFAIIKSVSNDYFSAICIKISHQKWYIRGSWCGEVKVIKDSTADVNGTNHIID